MRFYILDVFAEAKYRGNQLAVFRDAAGLTAEEMLAVAREINFAETTFILSEDPAKGFEVRIFTPEYEVPFAGHPSLGTAFVISEHILHSRSETVRLRLKIGEVPVAWKGESLWLTAAQPRFRDDVFESSDIAGLLGLTAADMDVSTPVEWVSTGLPYLIIPVRSLDAMRRIRIDEKQAEEWLRGRGLHKSVDPDGLTCGFFSFCRETYESDRDINARMLYLDADRMIEDAATGSANSCLLAYLLKYRKIEGPLLVEQGYEINRPSLIEIEGTLSQDGVYMLGVGGKVEAVAEGRWR